MNPKTILSRLKQGLVLFFSASLIFANFSAYAGDIVTYIHTDRLGNPVAKTNSVGAVIWRQSYTPYGEADRQSEQDGPGYTGHRYDASTGLVYMQARYYDPKIGRFLSPDPVTFAPNRPAYFNRYWYAKGNPYRYTDPDGRNFTMGLAGLLYETYSAVTGNGFHGDRVLGAFADGYNGEGQGALSAAVQDVSTIAAAVSGVGAVRAIATKGAAAAVKAGVKTAVKKSVADGKITGHTKHGLNQSISRNGGRGVSAEAKLDAVKNPTKVTEQSGGRTKYSGKSATVVTNKDGKVITTYGKPRDPTVKDH
ncbi:MAG TPA: RHS repeat-associated core domain-containing protein [Candidatus Saccharimonadales bacterium]|nr:RHS repeat-associated core domain-containing protein [Candidatus Saccharimonadales bacterium]